MQKSVAFLYTNCKRNQEKNSIYNHIKKNKLPRNKFKEIKDLYSENYKLLMKEIEDTNKWKYILCSWIGRINIVKMSILSKAICRFTRTKKKAIRKKIIKPQKGKQKEEEMNKEEL